MALTARRKTPNVEVMQFTPHAVPQILKWARPELVSFFHPVSGPGLVITPEGPVNLDLTDWIIKDADGSLSVRKGFVFVRSYDVVGADFTGV